MVSHMLMKISPSVNEPGTLALVRVCRCLKNEPLLGASPGYVGAPSVTMRGDNI
jgi:hypothetical protein